MDKREVRLLVEAYDLADRLNKLGFTRVAINHSVSIYIDKRYLSIFVHFTDISLHNVGLMVFDDVETLVSTLSHMVKILSGEGNLKIINEMENKE
jgi:hypothetical protein